MLLFVQPIAHVRVHLMVPLHTLQSKCFFIVVHLNRRILIWNYSFIVLLRENVPCWHDVNGDLRVEKTVRGSVAGLSQNSSLIPGFRSFSFVSSATSVLNWLKLNGSSTILACWQDPEPDYSQPEGSQPKSSFHNM